MIEAPDKAKGVAAVFVTMNRCGVARTCLDRLVGQTLRPGKVLVVDNASTDTTATMLSDASAGSGGWIETLALPQNLGNAGGMEIALRKLFADGHEAAWILDDDSWPEPDTLGHLLAAEVPENAVRSCKVVDITSGALSWPVQVPARGGWTILEGLDPLPSGSVIRIRRSWLGSLIPREVYDRVGPIEGRLFLRGEDEDYPRRIEQAGFPVYMIATSLLHHPPAGRLNRWEFAGHAVVMESGLSGDKLYYRLRNSWWMTRRDRGNVKAVVAASLNFVALCRWESSMMTWLPVWWEAARDAFLDRLGSRSRPSVQHGR